MVISVDIGHPDLYFRLTCWSFNRKLVNRMNNSVLKGKIDFPPGANGLGHVSRVCGFFVRWGSLVFQNQLYFLDSNLAVCARSEWGDVRATEGRRTTCDARKTVCTIRMPEDRHSRNVGLWWTLFRTYLHGGCPLFCFPPQPSSVDCRAFVGGGGRFSRQRFSPR